MIAWGAALLVAISAATPADGGRFAILPPCAAASDARVAPPLPVRVDLYAGADVSVERARAAFAGARSWWGRHGVEIEVVHTARVPFTAALAGAEDLATAPAFRGWLGRGAGDDAIIDVVILPSVAAPGSAATRVLSRLDGLTLRPEALATGDAFPLARALALPSRMRTTVLVGLDGWRRRRPSDADTLAAHELGHALGLRHTTSLGSLMTPGPHRCVPYITAVEAEAVRLR